MKLYDQLTIIGKVAEISPDVALFRERYLNNNIPVLLKGAASDWIAVEKWKDVNYLKQKFPENKILKIEEHQNTKEHSFNHLTHKIVDMKASDFFDHISKDYSNDHLLYKSGNYPIQTQNGTFACQWRHLKSDVKIPPFVNNEKFIKSSIFCGPRDYFSDLHYHLMAEAFLAQIVGEKTFVLIPPEYMKHTYLSSLFAVKHNFSEVLLDKEGKIDFDIYPDMKNVRAFIGTVRPGDMIYIPPYWGHCVFSSSDTFSMSAVTFFNCETLKKSFASSLVWRSFYNIVSNPRLFKRLILKQS